MLNQLSPILQSIDTAPQKCGATTLITIDGPAGSGKTTLAREIAAALADSNRSSVTIHMDSLYNGWDDALTSTLASTLRKVVLPAFESTSPGEKFSLPYFDWLINKFGPEEEYVAAPFTILEGVGAGSQVTRKYTSVALWIEAPLEIALERVLLRDGFDLEGPMKGFKKAELTHFTQEGTKAAAHHILHSA